MFTNGINFTYAGTAVYQKVIQFDQFFERASFRDIRQQEEPPPDNKQITRSFQLACSAILNISKVALSPFSSGSGWPASETSIKFNLHEWPYLTTICPSVIWFPSIFSTSDPIIALAFPAPITYIFSMVSIEKR